MCFARTFATYEEIDRVIRNSLPSGKRLISQLLKRMPPNLNDRGRRSAIQGL